MGVVDGGAGLGLVSVLHRDLNEIKKKLINNGQKIPPIYSKTCLIRHLSNSILQCYLTLSFIHNLPFIYIFSTV